MKDKNPRDFYFLKRIGFNELIYLFFAILFYPLWVLLCIITSESWETFKEVIILPFRI